MKQPPVPVMDGDNAVTEVVDFVDPTEPGEALNPAFQVGSNAIRLGLCIERQAAVTLERILEIPVREQLVEPIAAVKSLGWLPYGNTGGQYDVARQSGGDPATMVHGSLACGELVQMIPAEPAIRRETRAQGYRRRVANNHSHGLTRAARGWGMIIGYARVSTTEQNLDLQRDALKRAGCEKIIEDTVSGGKVQRPGLERVHDALRSGDVLAVWRLDRLGRSLKHLIELMAELEAERIGFQSVTESIDTTTPGGKLVFHIFGALAEFERNLIRERTYAGLAAARARGRKGGRRKKLGEKQRAVAVDLYRQKKHTIDEICKAVGISRPTLYKYVAAASAR